MTGRSITGQQILAARDEPAGSASPAGWRRETLEAWGVPWPPPLFWIHKLIVSGVPYAEPSTAEIRSSPLLRSILWTDPAEAAEQPSARVDLREALAPDPAPPPQASPSPPAPRPRSGKGVRKPPVADDAPRLF